MKRRLFNLAAALSLLLCLATVGLWVRDKQERTFIVVSEGKGKVVNISPGIWFDLRDRRDDQERIIVVVDRHLHFAGLHYVAQGTRFRLLSIPYWTAVCLLAITPAYWLTAYTTKAIRLRRGHCRACGYDLRATPDRCPECGTVPAVK